MCGFLLVGGHIAPKLQKAHAQLGEHNEVRKIVSSRQQQQPKRGLTSVMQRETNTKVWYVFRSLQQSFARKKGFVLSVRFDDVGRERGVTGAVLCVSVQKENHPSCPRFK